MILENQRKKINIIRFVILLIILGLLIGFFVTKKNNNPIQNSSGTIPVEADSGTNEETIFAIDSILFYSSANAISNSETQKDYWNLNVYQYTDMSIMINNHVYSDKLTATNLVTKLYIDNVTFSVKPILGTPGLFYKNPTSLGKPVVDDLDNKISDRLDFTVNSENSTVDYTKPSFYADCSNPLTLSYVNSSVDSSLIIKNSSSTVTFDGSLLEKSGTKLNNINATVNFTIHIINANDDEFTCDVSLPIPLSDDQNSIYDGHYVKELTNLEDLKFTKITK